MFSHWHYVPVMRTKGAELAALRTLQPKLRSLITPLLEFPPRLAQECRALAQLEAATERIALHLAGWSGRSVFVDTDILGRTEPSVTAHLASSLARAGIRPVMVASLKTGPGSSYTRSILAVLERHGSGICLRISSEELRLTSVEMMIRECLRRYGASPAMVDLIVDRRGVQSDSYTFSDFASRIPSIDSWGSLTVIAGSFPKDLSRLARGETHRLARHEWVQWQALASWKGRRPAFGDYTIQHPYFSEPPAFPNVSASVRYTLEDEFLVMRGEGVLNEGSPGYAQYNGWAQLLVDRPDYFGREFSAGDRYISERSINRDSTGTPRTWLQAAFSHHLTTTALQVVGRLEQAKRVAIADQRDWATVVSVDLPQPPASQPPRPA
jgi:hypothetical protein